MIDHEPHVSDLRWDRLLAGDLSAELRDAVSAHAAGCAACATRLREITAERDAFKLRPVAFRHSRPARRARWWWGAPIAALAATAVAIVMVRKPPDETERPKGGGTKLLLSAGRPGHLTPLASGDVIHPGDHVQAGYSAERDGFGAVLALDGAGAAIAYVPSRGDSAMMIALPAGLDRSFPESTVLDDVVGSEHIVVLWCESTHPVRSLLEELRATRQVTVPPGCIGRTLVLDKRVPR